jgi:hypothetical protein
MLSKPILLLSEGRPKLIVKDDAGCRRADQWYDRRTRSWITQTFDAEGSELTAAYDGNRTSASVSWNDALEFLGVDPKTGKCDWSKAPKYQSKYA